MAPAAALFAFLYLPIVLAQPTTSESADAELLLAFKGGFFNGAEVLASWRNGTEPCGTWTGIICEGGAVTDIVLDAKALNGTIPPGGWALPPTLIKLSLFNNLLHGSIPADFEVPPQLKELELTGNFLASTLPPIQLPPSLEYLGLYYNRLSGTIPEDWELPESLRDLAIAWNDLTGTLPINLCLPANLSSFTLDHNRLTGSISPDWELNENLNWLDLSANLLTGSIPEAWAEKLPVSLNQLGLGLHNNSLTGTLPVWPHLEGASVYVKPGNIALCGEVPATPRYMQQVINEQGTQLEPVPVKKLQACKSDKQLLLDFKASFDNGATVLPSWKNATSPCDGTWTGIACSGGKVTDIYLHRKGLEGTVPAAGWLFPASMSVLVLTENSIQGALPPAQSLPPKLDVLHLGGNQLSGGLWEGPPWKGGEQQLPARLESLRLNGKQLSGTLPGPDPYYRIILPKNLEVLDLGQNQFSGPLPVEPGFRLPSSLQELMLNSNQFNGTIPAGMALPSNMTLLDLSNNLLTSSIPAKWGALLPASLNRRGMSLFNNSFSGSLPSWPQLSGATVYVQPGNAKLCGQVPPSPMYTTFVTIEGIKQADELLTTLPNCTNGGASGSSSGSSTAAIVGGVVGGVCGLVLLGLLVWWAWRRKRPSPAPHLDFEKSKAGKAGTDGTVDCATGMEGKEEEPPSKSSAVSSGDDAARQSTSPSPPYGMIPVTPHQASQDLLSSDTLLSSILSKLPGSLKSGSGTSMAPKSKTPSSKEVHVDVNTWLVPFQALCLSKPIGRGSFGRVYLASWNETWVAVKLLLGLEASHEADIGKAADLVLSSGNPLLGNLRAEASMMASLRHPNILSFLGWCEAPPCLVSEYCPRGSLYDTLQQARSSSELARALTWVVRLRMALGAALGMLHLHSRTPAVVHRDLKTPNLLIGPNWTVKVADFNLSKIAVGEGSVVTSGASVGNPRWLAPEVLAGGAHTFSSDVYSYGLILWELLTWQPPFEGTANFWQVSAQVMSGGRPPIPPPEQLPGDESDLEGLPAYIDLMQRCWAQSPSDRPTFQEIVKEVKQLALAASRRSGAGAGSTAGSLSPSCSGLYSAASPVPAPASEEPRDEAGEAPAGPSSPVPGSSTEQQPGSTPSKARQQSVLRSVRIR